jgi:Leucine-rich repeat (LRR) protein
MANNITEDDFRCNDFSDFSERKLQIRHSVYDDIDEEENYYSKSLKALNFEKFTKYNIINDEPTTKFYSIYDASREMPQTEIINEPLKTYILHSLHDASREMPRTRIDINFPVKEVDSDEISKPVLLINPYHGDNNYLVYVDTAGYKFMCNIKNLLKSRQLLLTAKNISYLYYDAFLFHLHFLEKIILNDNYIKYLPYDIFHKCSNLVKIDLSKNKLDKIEKGLFDGCQKLEEINLSFNRIQSIEPDSFSKCVELVEIRLKKNQIKTLPQDLFHMCIKLEIIDLRKNNIKMLPPELFQESFNARKIHLSENQIEQIPILLFQSCKRLEKIYLDNNQIKELPWQIFNECKQLQTIEFSFNQIEEIHLDLFDPKHFEKISHISFGSNLIKGVPFFHSRKNLKIDFRNNVELELDLQHFIFELFSIVKCDSVEYFFGKLYPSFKLKKNEYPNKRIHGIYPIFDSADSEYYCFCRRVELSMLKETLFALYLNKKVYNLKNNVCQQFEQYFGKIYLQQWSILDFLIIAIEKDVFTNENLIYLNTFIQNLIDQDPTLINLEFIMKSTQSIEHLCQRDDIRLFHELVDLNNIENRDYDYKNFFKNINFRKCFYIVLERNNEKVAIYLLKMVSYYKSIMKSKFNGKFNLFNKEFLEIMLPKFFDLKWIEAIEFILETLINKDNINHLNQSFLEFDLKNIFLTDENNQDNIDSIERQR